MKNRISKTLLGAAVAAAMLTSSCATHYQLNSVSRQRLVVDSRYDGGNAGGAARFLAPYKARVDSVMSPVMGTVAHDMAAQRPESDLSNLLPDILMWAAPQYGETPDFGIYNIGGIRAALSKGPVTYGDVLDVAPFENKICFLTLTGEQVMQLFRQIARRGGEGVSHGVNLVISSDGALVSARLHGEEIFPDKSYRVTTIDYLAQGNDQLTAFKAHTNLNSPKEDSNNTRFIIMDYFRQKAAKGEAVDAKTEGRIIVEQKH